MTTLESNSADAVKRIQEDDYDAVLCDLMMPTLTGMGVYRLSSKSVRSRSTLCLHERRTFL